METKKEFRYFNIMEYEKEALYLQERHKQGWKFVKVTGLGVYHFVKCEPENVVYQLDYNQEGISAKQEYVQMFNDCGWEYLMDFMGYSYFRKPASEMKENESIFCDDDSRLEMMNRVFKGRLIPLIVIFFCILIPQTIAQFSLNNIIFYMFMVLIIIYLVIFINFAIKYVDYKKRLGK